MERFSAHSVSGLHTQTHSAGRLPGKDVAGLAWFGDRRGLSSNPPLPNQPYITKSEARFGLGYEKSPNVTLPLCFIPYSTPESLVSSSPEWLKESRGWGGRVGQLSL